MLLNKKSIFNLVKLHTESELITVKERQSYFLSLKYVRTL